MSRLLDTVAKTFRKDISTYDRLGIEIELEGKNLYDPNVPLTLWKTHEEGSLRGGVEYVTDSQCTVEDLNKYMEEFRKCTAKARFRNSIRTSVHIHVDVRKMTLSELYVALCLFYLIEDTLVAANGANRVGNLFCLRGRDAEDIFHRLFKDAEDNTHFHSWTNQNRYSSQNLSAIAKFGSVEYRFLKGLTDPDIIALWARNLVMMVHGSRRFRSLDDLVSCYENTRYTRFLRDCFTPEFFDYLRGHAPISSLNPDHNNVGHIIHLSNLLKRRKRRLFKIQEDLDEIDEFPIKEKPVKQKLAGKSGLYIVQDEAQTLVHPNWHNIVLDENGG